MRKILRGTLLAAVLGTVVAGSARADLPEVPAPHLYVAPTVGFWRWDGEAPTVGDVVDDLRPMYGLRLGYAPLEALSGELVLLTGTNAVESSTVTISGSDELRLTQLELSFLVNFRSLNLGRFYPFVNLGGGVVFRSSDATAVGEPVFDGSHVAFHLGGGFKADLGRLTSVRLNVRDSFLTETRAQGTGRETQVTVDAVELSAVFEYRIPFSARGRPERLR